MENPCNERTDVEKIKSNWTKTCRLYQRGEYSVAIIRAVTTIELTANFIIREELQKERHLPKEFVDHLLIWANGISGKFDRLILPICRGSSKEEKFKAIRNKVATLNKERNSVVHSGQFKKKKTAGKVIKEARTIILILMREYKIDSRLKDIE
jgi:hypothetical protein